MGSAQGAGAVARKVLAAAVGAVVAIAVAGCQLGDEGSERVDEIGDASVVVQDDGFGSGGDTSFYDSGSITTTDDGEIIYSDDSGNSFSTGY